MWCIKLNANEYLSVEGKPTMYITCAKLFTYAYEAKAYMREQGYTGPVFPA